MCCMDMVEVFRHGWLQAAQEVQYMILADVVSKCPINAQQYLLTWLYI